MKRLLAVLAVGALIVTAGCLGGGAIDERALGEPASYDWNTSADVDVTIAGGSYQAVLSMETRRNVSLFGPGEFGGESALSVSAVKYRYSNGTVVNASAIEVSEVGERTVIEVGESGGQLGYTAVMGTSELFVPVAINGSYAVTLPPGTDVRAPIVGGARPAGFVVDTEADSLTLRWNAPDTQFVTVDYYQERNLYIFGAILGIAGVVAGAGFLYFRAQIRALAMRRAAVGPDELQ